MNIFQGLGLNACILRSRRLPFRHSSIDRYLKRLSGLPVYTGLKALLPKRQIPKHNLPIGMIATLLIGTLLYSMAAAAFTGMVPSIPCCGSADHGWEARVALRPSLGITLTMRTVLLSMQLVQVRLFYSMSRDGMLPKNSAASTAGSVPLFFPNKICRESLGIYRFTTNLMLYNTEIFPVMKTSKRLAGQTAIVTGASSGIGEAVALTLGREGANVVVNYYSHPELAEDLAHAISQDNDCGDAIAIQCDVSREEQVIAMFKQTIGHFGNLDICIANAGIQIDKPLHEMTLEQWQKVLDVNLTGQFLCAREAIKAFLKQGMRPEVSKSLGKIIHMSSVHQIIPWAGHANYAASKGAIVMLMESICQEYAPLKIRCNSIAPGAIKTPINTSAWNTPEALANLNKLIPYKRIGVPEDIGQAAAWLASDESEYVNGTTLFVDGGMTCYPGFATNG